MSSQSKKSDLGVKVGSKVQKFWKDLRLRCEEAIFNNEQTIIADKHLLELADKKIAEEIKSQKT